MRHMFRRNIRKTLAQDVPPILQEANFAFDKGEYGRAAELFEQMRQDDTDCIVKLKEQLTQVLTKEQSATAA